MKTLILDTTLNENNYPYNDYKEFCELNEVECSPEYSEDYYSWMYTEIEDNIEAFLDSIDFNGLDNFKVEIFSDDENKSYADLWNGKREIKGIVNDFNELYKRITNNCDNIVVYKDNDFLRIEGIHHDGTNVYNIRFLDEDNNIVNLDIL